MARPYSEKTIAKVINNATYVDFYNRLRLLAKTIFEWTGFPEKVNTRFLEKCLYEVGSCCFYDDPEFGFMIARCNTANIMNIYDEPTHVTTVSNAPNYNPKELEINEDCILIRNNAEMIPTDYTIQLFSARLYKCQRSIDNNIDIQKFPFIVLCDNKQLLSFKKMIEDINENELAIYGEKTLNMENLKTLETEAPFVADKLNVQKTNIWNECMTFLGLNNANTEKRERLITDEANANNELIEMMFQIMYHERKLACEQINKKYGLNVDVKMRKFDQSELELDNKENKDEDKDSKIVDFKKEGVV